MNAMPLAVSQLDRTPFEESTGSVVERDLLATLDPLGRTGRLWIAGLAAVVSVAAAAWIYQLVHGLRVTDMGNFVSWGAYMTNFVFFIGISHAGTLISAILRVTDAGWRRPITRMAEAITVYRAARRREHGGHRHGTPRSPPEPAHPRAAAVADPLGPGVGYDVHHGQLPVSVRGDDPGYADPRPARARARPFAASHSPVRDPVARIPGVARASPPAGARARRHGRHHHSGRRVGAHGRVVGIRHDAAPWLAQHNFRPVLRDRRDLFGHRGDHHRHGDLPPGVPSRALSPAGAFPQAGEDPARAVAALRLLHVERIPHHVVRRRSRSIRGSSACSPATRRTARSSGSGRRSACSSRSDCWSSRADGRWARSSRRPC